MPDARQPVPPSLASFAKATDRFRRPLAIALAGFVVALSPATALAALGRSAASLAVFVLFLTAFLAAPLVVLAVFACALVAAERARRRG